VGLEYTYRDAANLGSNNRHAEFGAHVNMAVSTEQAGAYGVSRDVAK